MASGVVTPDSINAAYGLYLAGIYSKGTASVSLTNAGTILGGGTKGTGIIIGSGSIGNTGLIQAGKNAIQIGKSGSGVGTVVNYGSVIASGTTNGYAVKLAAGGSITNGASNVTTALITAPEEAIGVYGGYLDKIPMSSAINRSLTFRMAQTPVQHYLPQLMERIQKGEIDPSFVITHRATLEEGPELYKTFRDKKDGCIKVVMKP